MFVLIKVVVLITPYKSMMLCDVNGFLELNDQRCHLIMEYLQTQDSYSYSTNVNLETL